MRGYQGLRFEPIRIPTALGPPQEPELFRTLAAGRTGGMWAAGERGLARFDHGVWKRYTQGDGLKSNMVDHVAEDKDGSVWVGYRDSFGLTKLSFAGGQTRAEYFGVGTGPRSEKTVSLFFDARGWLWAGTDHGADVFDGVRWSHYGRGDGLIWDDCNGNATFRSVIKGSVRCWWRKASAPALLPPIAKDSPSAKCWRRTIPPTPNGNTTYRSVTRVSAT